MVRSWLVHLASGALAVIVAIAFLVQDSGMRQVKVHTFACTSNLEADGFGQMGEHLSQKAMIDRYSHGIREDFWHYCEFLAEGDRVEVVFVDDEHWNQALIRSQDGDLFLWVRLDRLSD